MIEPRENLSLGFQSIVIGARDQAWAEQFDRDLLVVFVTALGEIDVAHAAAPDPVQQPPRPQDLARAIDFPLS